jgi:hypothetical protein
MKQFQYYLDGAPIADPLNWRDFKEVIRLDKDLRGQLKIVDTTMRFHGEAFTTLWYKAQNDWDSISILTIYESPGQNESFMLAYRGVILTSDIEFEHTRRIAEVKVRDESFEAQLSGGKNIKVNVEATLSKNGATITPAQRSVLTVVNPCTGITPGLTEPTLWRLDDVFRQVIAYLSDGQVDFYSPLLEHGGEFDGLGITNGAFLKPVVPAAEVRAPSVSLRQCLTEIGRKRNTVYYIDESGDRPVFTVDYARNIRTENKSVSIRGVRNIRTSFDVDKIYSSVKFGSTEFVERGSEVCSDVSYFEEIDFYTIKEEEYAVIGTNNIDNQLDLSTEWIVSNNLIQASYFNGETDNDKEVFLIDARNDATWATTFTVHAEQFDVLGDGGAIFNYRLFNSEVSQQFLGGVPMDIILRLSPISDLFKAYLTDQPVYLTSNFTEPVQFDDDHTLGNDPGGNYGNATVQGTPVARVDSRWTAPATGIANMRVKFSGYIYDSATLFLPAGHVIALKFRKYSSTNTLLGTFTKEFTNGQDGYQFDPNTPNVLDFEKSIYVAAGDYIQVWLGTVTAASNAIHYERDLQGETFFELTADSFSGGTMKEYDSADYPVYLIEGEKKISLDQWNSIDQNRFDQIEVSDDFGNRFSGWIDQVEYSRVTGQLGFKLTATKSEIVG